MPPKKMAKLTQVPVQKKKVTPAPEAVRSAPILIFRGPNKWDGNSVSEPVAGPEICKDTVRLNFDLPAARSFMGPQLTAGQINIIKARQLRKTSSQPHLTAPGSPLGSPGPKAEFEAKAASPTGRTDTGAPSQTSGVTTHPSNVEEWIRDTNKSLTTETSLESFDPDVMDLQAYRTNVESLNSLFSEQNEKGIFSPRSFFEVSKEMPGIIQSLKSAHVQRSTAFGMTDNGWITLRNYEHKLDATAERTRASFFPRRVVLETPRLSSALAEGDSMARADLLTQSGGFDVWEKTTAFLDKDSTSSPRQHRKQNSEQGHTERSRSESSKEFPGASNKQKPRAISSAMSSSKTDRSTGQADKGMEEEQKASPFGLANLGVAGRIMTPALRGSTPLRTKSGKESQATDDLSRSESEGRKGKSKREMHVHMHPGRPMTSEGPRVRRISRRGSPVQTGQRRMLSSASSSRSVTSNPGAQKLPLGLERSSFTPLSNEKGGGRSILSRSGNSMDSDPPYTNAGDSSDEEEIASPKHVLSVRLRVLGTHPPTETVQRNSVTPYSSGSRASMREGVHMDLTLPYPPVPKLAQQRPTTHQGSRPSGAVTYRDSTIAQQDRQAGLSRPGHLSHRDGMSTQRIRPQTTSSRNPNVSPAVPRPVMLGRGQDARRRNSKLDLELVSQQKLGSANVLGAWETESPFSP